MKIFILFDFKDGPYGGGNQFLKSLSEEFKKRNLITNEIEQSDIVLFNSNPDTLLKYGTQLAYYKLKFPGKVFVNRLDGPIFLIRGNDKKYDKLFYILSHKLFDGTVFQSNWSKIKSQELGFSSSCHTTILQNAPDSRFFNGTENNACGDKIRVVITSWSSNTNKGFEVYKWLDENLDFSKIALTFIGNSPYKFVNIRMCKPLATKELSKELQNYHIFLTASKNDPCSNSLIEALHLGLPAIALNDGGHPEIIGSAGETFCSKDEIPGLIHQIFNNIEKYRSNINLPSIKDVSNGYLNFFKECNNSKKNVRKISILIILCRLIRLKISLKLHILFQKLFNK